MFALTLQLPDEIVQEFEQSVSSEKQSRENIFIKALRLFLDSNIYLSNFVFGGLAAQVCKLCFKECLEKIFVCFFRKIV